MYSKALRHQEWAILAQPYQAVRRNAPYIKVIITWDTIVLSFVDGQFKSQHIWTSSLRLQNTPTPNQEEEVFMNTTTISNTKKILPQRTDTAVVLATSRKGGAQVEKRPRCTAEENLSSKRSFPGSLPLLLFNGRGTELLGEGFGNEMFLMHTGTGPWHV